MGKLVPASYDSGFEGYKINYVTYEATPLLRYELLFLLFCFFWTVEFMKALNAIVTAIAIAKWYFAPDRSQMASEKYLYDAYSEAIRYTV